MKSLKGAAAPRRPGAGAGVGAAGVRGQQSADEGQEERQGSRERAKRSKHQTDPLEQAPPRPHPLWALAPPRCIQGPQASLGSLPRRAANPGLNLIMPDPQWLSWLPSLPGANPLAPVWGQRPGVQPRRLPTASLPLIARLCPTGRTFE